MSQPKIRAMLTWQRLAQLSLAVLIACSGAEKIVSTNQPPPPASGQLTIAISGLPAGDTAAVSVTSASGASTHVTGSKTLSLAPGSYAVSAVAVTYDATTYNPLPATQTVSVAASATASATVTYAPPPPPTRYSLTIVGTGTGGGTITSSPSGIDCTITNGSVGASGCGASYTAGTVVTLTASPSAGDTFAGWSGACSGSGTCQVKLGADTSVTGSFAAPTSGNLTVADTVMGSNQPAGPFTVTIDPAGNSPIIQSITKNGSVTISGLAAGSHAVRLTGSGIGTGTNCTITGGSDQTVTVTAAGTASVSYAINCAAPTATTQAASNITTAGLQMNGLINPNGGSAQGWFEWGTSAALSTFSSTTAGNMGSGTTGVPLTSNLTGLNCNTTYYYRAVAGPAVGSVVRGAVVSATTSACSPTTGNLAVTNTVTGNNQPAGPFTVTIDAAGSSPITQSVAKNGTATIPGLAAGSHDVRLTGSGIGTGANCTITGGFEKTVTVTAGATASVTYAITCMAPTPTTQAAGSITASSLQMNGLINPNGGTTQGWFEWGTSSSLNTFSTTTPGNMGAGTSDVPLTSNLTGLSCNTAYYFRAVAGPSSGSVVRGSILSATTSACPTQTGDLAVSNTITGSNQPAGPFTVTIDAASSSPTSQPIAKNGSGTIQGLTAGTHDVRLTGSGIGTGTNCTIAGGFDQTVTVTAGATASVSYAITCVAPTATTQAASNITGTGLQMNGLINPNGGSTQGWFEWGTSASLSTFSATTAASMGSGTSDVPLTSTLTGLSCGTTYYYRAVAGPAVGSVVRGSIVSATNACQPPAGDLTITVGGLPSGASGAASVFSSGGTLVGSLPPGSNPTTFNNLAAGTYSIHAFSVTFGGQTYNPTAATQSATVTAGGNTNVSITYQVPVPTATTQAASNITATGLQMNGLINPNGASTQGWFEWGTSASLSTFSLTTAASMGSGTSNVALTSTLTSLTCGSTYYYRAVAGPAVGSVVRGSVLSATTSACPTPVPTATTQAATNITGTGLQMNGLINPNGGSTQGWFEWGTSASLNTFSLTTAGNMGSGTSNVTLTSTLTSLSCGTTYYYRAVAGPAVGSVVRGSILSVTTSACQTTGDLTILVQGLPSGASGAASVFTSGGTLVGSLPPGSNPTTFNNLAAGTYSIHAFSVTFGGQTYNPTAATLSATVTVGANTNVIITYQAAVPTADDAGREQHHGHRPANERADQSERGQHAGLVRVGDLGVVEHVFADDSGEHGVGHEQCDAHEHSDQSELWHYVLLSGGGRAGRG